MSHKIKICFSDNKTKPKKKEVKTEYINKISINFSDNIKEETKKTDFKKLISKSEFPSPEKKKINKNKTNVSYDKNITKLFKNDNYRKLDLHGHSLEGARERLLKYCAENSKQNNLFHIIITGLGNKRGEDTFFSGKIRNSFKDWVRDDPINRFVHSFYPCKIKHGGLGAYYLKLRFIK